MTSGSNPYEIPHEPRSLPEPRIADGFKRRSRAPVDADRTTVRQIWDRGLDDVFVDANNRLNRDRGKFSSS